MVLKIIFVPKTDEVTGGWRKLHYKKLHNLYSSPSIIRMITSGRMIWVGHIPRLWEKRNAYGILVERPEVKRLLGGPKRRWMDNIKLYPREIGWDDEVWITLTLVNTVLKLQVP
jgi:hypothetical protein